MAFCAYMLRCGDESYYTGHTDDLEQRWAQHLDRTFGGYTAKRHPLILVWAGEFQTRDEALACEIRVKKWSRAKKEALIAEDWERLSYFAKPPSRRATEPSLDTGSRLRSTPARDERMGGNPETIQNRLSRADIERSRDGQSRERAQNSDPIIVLVRPQLGENIGKAARAMLNFGLRELRLVAPRDGWPNPSAGPSAAGADIVLEQARIFETTAEAVADCAQIYATTVRKREDTKPVVTPEQAATQIISAKGRSAILFGPERSGLDIQDVSLARAIVTVPINPGFGSLNLAQAVILVSYEWSKLQALEQPTLEDYLPPAPQEELEGLIGHFGKLLEPKGYFYPEGRREATARTLRNVLTKPAWNHLEVRTLRGVLTHLSRQDRSDR